MIEELSLFADSDPQPTPATKPPMTPQQRDELRSLFGVLRKTTAREQFTLVEELIGVKLTSVADLNCSDASVLAERIRRRIVTQQRKSTGNSWADRDEDTWIDRL